MATASKVFDFRSDTVTKPTKEMLEYMITAEVGDDVRGEDPSVNELEKKVAELTGMEAALFVCSGVMGNQLCIRVHVTENTKQVVQQSIIIDDRAHIYKYELGGVAFHSGSFCKLLVADKAIGHITANQIENVVYLDNDLHSPITTIISLENTINGNIFDIEEIKKIHQLAKKHDLKMHLDGARLWNASAATGLKISDYTQYFDSVSLCLSKGLGAPVGTVIAGKKSFIEKAKQYRKLFGGGWRQAGVLAKCGIYAIDNNWQKMKKDHELAQLLFTKLTEIGFESDKPQTNMLFIKSNKLGLKFEDILKVVKEQHPNIRLDGHGYECRIVTHIQVDEEAALALVQALKDSVTQLKK